MNITPTLAGGLCLQPESEVDWEVLASIGDDIGRPGHLAESLAGLLEDESGDWDEFVVPDVKQAFDAQCQFASQAVAKARDNNEKAVYITKTEVDRWYGAVNQARISLQARYQFDKIEDYEDAPEELQSAHYRDRFYLTLQSIMLDYVMEG